ncbi:MAG: hypothetical protein PHO76_02635 [Methylotenera sp.]|nr:hypothetical protein [Methylotenera sp.]MDD4927240.1 hypothetical protein [Methylotenera sp.]
MNYSAKMKFYRACLLVHLDERAIMGLKVKGAINEDLSYWLNELGGLGSVW